MRTVGLIGTIIWAGLIDLIGAYAARKKTELVCGKEEERFTPLFAIFAILPLLLWAGFRDGRGYVDTNAYIKFFNMVPDTFEQLRYYIENVNNEDPGFTIYTAVIKRAFGHSYRPYLFITAAIQCFIVTFFYRKYSYNYCFSLFLFFASTDYFSWIFNGLRQFLAVVITIAGFQLLLDKKYFKYILIILLAITIHLSALIMIPLALVVTGKPWNRGTLITLGITVFILLFTNRFNSFLVNVMQNTQYGESIATWDDDGTNIIRAVFYSMPTVFAFICRKKIAEEDNPLINTCVNMSILSSAIWTVSVVTSGIYFGRLPIYFGLYNYILFPYLIDHYFDDSWNADTTKIGVVLVYLIYYYYQVQITWRALW